MANILFLKVTNARERHFGYQYVDGLNVLPTKEEFSTDPNVEIRHYYVEDETDTNEPKYGGYGLWMPGFHFTTAKFIHKFYTYGCYLRVVSFPKNNPDFKMTMNPYKDSFRANMIILGEKYSLNDLATYAKFNIPLPSIYTAVTQNLMTVVKHLVENNSCTTDQLDKALILATGHKKYDVARYLVANKADVRYLGAESLWHSIQYGDLKTVKKLVEKGTDIKLDILDYVKHCVNHMQWKILKYLLIKCNDVTVNDYAIACIENKGYFIVARHLKKILAQKN